MEHNYRASIKNLNIMYLGEVDLNGMKALKYELRGEVNGLRIVYLAIAVEGQNHFHQVLFWTLPTRWKDASGIYDTALASFTECANGCS